MGPTGPAGRVVVGVGKGDQVLDVRVPGLAGGVDLLPGRVGVVGDGIDEDLVEDSRVDQAAAVLGELGVELVGGVSRSSWARRTAAPAARWSVVSASRS